ncbi:hypothetical protein [Methanolobus sp. ZRKC5]|uniref:hypothetical protein n=1 Tax=unclassified Methanolobus TaxID=2629569 RepID=UPI00313BC544
MTNPDIATYIKEADLIEKMYMNLLGGTTQKRMKPIEDGSTGLPNVEYRICEINSKNEILQSALLQRYEDWYESCRELVQEYAGSGRTSKHEDLAELHQKIVTLIGLKDPVGNSNEKKHLRKVFIACFDAQVSIIHSVGHRIVLARNDRQRSVTANLVNSELEEAESLYEQGSFPHAGIIAGKALESYLKMLCDVNEVELTPEDTMLTMIQKIHESENAYKFDVGMLGAIEHLAALSAKCGDLDDEFLEDNIRELIDQTREMVVLGFC